MEIKKSLETMRNRIGQQIVERLQKVDLDSVLAAIGLQVIKRPRTISLPVLAAFSGGLAVGALFAPMPGKELRTRIALLLSRMKRSPTDRVLDDSEREKTAYGEPVESPYETAKAEREPSGGNGQLKGSHPTELKASTAP